MELAHGRGRTRAFPASWPRSCPTPAHFEQACELVTREKVADAVPCGNDPERFVEAIKEFERPATTYLYIQQIGPDQAGFLDFFEREVRPRL